MHSVTNHRDDAMNDLIPSDDAAFATVTLPALITCDLRKVA